MDPPHSTALPGGRRVLLFPLARLHSVFERIKVLRTGCLRVVFAADLKVRERGGGEVYERGVNIQEANKQGVVFATG